MFPHIFLLNELGVMRQCPLPALPLLLLLFLLLRPRRSLQIEPSASAVAFSDGEGGVGAEKKKMPPFCCNFWRNNLFQADYPVYPGYGEEEDQHLQEEEEEDQKSGERGSGLNVKDEVCRFPSFCSISCFAKHEISFCARLASCSWTLGRSPRFLRGGAGEGESG